MCSGTEHLGVYTLLDVFTFFAYPESLFASVVCGLLARHYGTWGTLTYQKHACIFVLDSKAVCFPPNTLRKSTNQHMHPQWVFSLFYQGFNDKGPVVFCFFRWMSQRSPLSAHFSTSIHRELYVCVFVWVVVCFLFMLATVCWLSDT